MSQISPAPPGRIRGLRPAALSCRATSSVVCRSAKPSSGSAWISRRQRTTSAVCSASHESSHPGPLPAPRSATAGSATISRSVCASSTVTAHHRDPWAPAGRGRPAARTERARRGRGEFRAEPDSAVHPSMVLTRTAVYQMEWARTGESAPRGGADLLRAGRQGEMNGHLHVQLTADDAARRWSRRRSAAGRGRPPGPLPGHLVRHTAGATARTRRTQREWRVPSPEDGQQRRIGGRYLLSALLGSGAMGTVWSGFDEVLQRRVAVKELKVPPGVPAHEAAGHARTDHAGGACARRALPSEHHHGVRRRRRRRRARWSCWRWCPPATWPP